MERKGKSAEEKARQLKVLFLDVDGVLTDGRIGLLPDGQEIKWFDVKDGLGLNLLKREGISVVLVSGRRSVSVERRALELGIDRIHQGVDDKRSLVRQIQEQMGVESEETGSVGDDIPDLAMFGETGLRFATADAVREIKEAADLVTKNKGGRGAVREICEYILSCRDRWDKMVRRFAGE
jgi:YrbI family 3-deoxy-D-manno-octulosonate 8-phosphate phosphatase